MEALKLVETKDFDSIFFMDIQMPVLDVIETTKLLKEKFKEMKKNDIPIVALTANGETQKKACHDAGMSDFLLKPVKEEQLRNVINKYII